MIIDTFHLGRVVTALELQRRLDTLDLPKMFGAREHWFVTDAHDSCDDYGAPHAHIVSRWYQEFTKNAPEETEAAL